MNLRRIYNRVKDSTSEVQTEIDLITSQLEELGVDYEVQDIGESDAEYLSYLHEMLPPPIQDSTYNESNAMSADSLSALIPQMDFPVDITYDDTDGADLDTHNVSGDVVLKADAGEYGIAIFTSDEIGRASCRERVSSPV